ncbi:MAG: sulfatase-like hydrolase/transferase [Pseudomonadota bacterium]
MIAERPNVVLISSDQQRGDCIGHDRRGVKTPNIDRIATAGARFTSAITPHPMCQAARASILTGLLPYTNGVRDNGRDLDPVFGAQGLGGIFARAGYATHFVGKAHFSTHETFAPTGRPECYKSAAEFSGSWNGPYFGFDNTRLMLRPHHHTAWTDPPQTLHYENWLDADGKGRERWERAQTHLPPETGHFQAWRSALEEEWHSSAWCGDEAVRIIEDAHAPLFMWLSFPDPHPPFEAPRPWCDLYDPAAVDLPPHFALDLDRRPWWHRAFLDNKKRTSHAPENWQGGINWGERGTLTEAALRDVTALYYGMISELDHHVGRVVDALAAAGMAENTLVIFISDHGEWLGDHGLLLKGPMLYDGLLRVPCVMSGPGIGAGRVIDEPVSTLDIRATLADLCALDGAPDHGRSWRDLLAGNGTRDFALSEWEVDAARSGVDLDLKTVRTARYRLTVDERTDTGELYDLQEDPFEMDNIFADPARASVERELRDMIASRPADQIPASPRVGWH